MTFVLLTGVLMLYVPYVLSVCICVHFVDLRYHNHDCNSPLHNDCVSRPDIEEGHNLLFKETVIQIKFEPNVTPDQKLMSSYRFTKQEPFKKSRRFRPDQTANSGRL